MRRAPPLYTVGMWSKPCVVGCVLMFTACAQREVGSAGSPRTPDRAASSAAAQTSPSDDDRSVAPDPARDVRWEPEAPQWDEGAGMAWAHASLSSHCAPPRTLPASIESESQFFEVVCKQSNVYWEHYTIAVYSGREPTATRGLRVTEVKATAMQTVVFVEPSGSCGADVWGTVAPVAIVPRQAPKVLFVKRAGPGLPECPTVGY